MSFSRFFRPLLVLSGLLLIAVFCILFWQPITQTFFEGCVNTYCRHYFGTPLEVEKIEREGDFLVFSQPVLYHQGAKLSADKLLFSIAMTPLERTLDVKLVVENSHVDLRERTCDLQQTIHEIISRTFPYWMLKLRLQFTINNGQISWSHPQENRDSSASFQFQMASDQGRSQGILELFLDQASSETNRLLLTAQQEAGAPIETTMVFSQIDCAKFSTICRSLGYGFRHWEIARGMLNGTLHLQKFEHSKMLAWGDVHVQDLDYSHRKALLAGHFNEVVIDLQASATKKAMPQLRGNIRVSAGRLRPQNASIPSWEVADLSCDMEILPENRLMVRSQMAGSYREKPFGLSLKGEIDPFTQKNTKASFDCRLSQPGKADAELDFVINEYPLSKHTIDVHFAKVQKEDVNLLQAIFLSDLEEFIPYEMLKGVFSGKTSFTIERGQLSEMIFQDFSGQDVAFIHNADQTTIAVDDLKTSFSLDFKGDDPFQTLDAEAALMGARIEILGLNDQLWHFETSRSDLSMQKGVLQNTQIQGAFEGLEGLMTIDWRRRKEALKIDLAGPADLIAKMMPQALHQHVNDMFVNQQVRLSGALARKRSGASFVGELRLVENESIDPIQFGFSLEKSSENFWNKWSTDPVTITFWESIGLEAMQAVVPPILFPSILLESNWIQSEHGLAGWVIRKGWFKTGKIPLEKYVSPLIFLYDEAVIKGEGVFKGVFDHESVALSYQAENVSLENPFLVMHVDAIGSFGASHYFNFKKGTHYGSLPLLGASYLEKKSGLLLTAIDTLAIFERSCVHLSELKTSCLGMMIRGSVDVDFGAPHDGRFSVAIHASEVHGGITQLQEVMSTIDSEIYPKNFQWSGEVSLAGQGANVLLDFSPEGLDFDAVIEGDLNHVQFALPTIDAKIDQGRLHFMYNHREKSLNLGSLFSEIALKTSSGIEKYILAADHVNFLDYTKGIAFFDVWIGDRQRDIVRFVGHTTAQAGGTFFHFDSDLTHIDNTKPTSLSLAVRDAKLDHFSIETEFKLPALLKTVENLWGSSLASRDSPLKKIDALKGSTHLQLAFDGGNEEWRWHVRGNKIAFNNFSFEEVLFKGRKRSDQWTFEKLMLDQLSLTGRGTSTNGDWYFEDIGVKYQDHLEAKLAIDYLSGDRVAKGHLEMLNLDLKRFSASLVPWKKNLSNYPISGRITASGSWEYPLSKDGSSNQLEGVFTVNLHSCGVAGLLFKDTEGVVCHFIPDQGIIIDALHTEILEPQTLTTRGSCHFERMTYDIRRGGMTFEDFSFQIPAHHLPWMTKTLYHAFPDLVSADLADVVRSSKLQGILEGVIQYDYNPPYTGLQLRLKDGAYTFLNADHEIKQFVLEYDPFEFRIESKYKVGNEFVWLHARSTSPNLSVGELILTEMTPEEYHRAQGRKGVYILWENHPEHGTSIRSIDGSLYGLDFRMKRDPLEPLSQKAMYLTGSVSIDAADLDPLVPKTLAQKISDWRMGRGYAISGKWKVAKEGSNEYGEQIFFRGLLEGKDCELKGFQFASFAAQLEYTPRKATIRDLLMNDPAGVMKIGHIAFVKEGESWYFSIPEVKVEKFRPGFLHSLDLERRTEKPSLVVSAGVLRSCQGRLDDPRSFTGEGEFRFANKSKRRAPNMLFQIPADLLSRIGLDPSLMTPVSGSVEYRLEEGEVRFVKFKEMYSQSKLSKFYLSPSYRSRMDFDGNLDIRVGMKQYNLLFKFAELCTIGIRGNLDKPTYSLQKLPERPSKRRK